MLILAIDTALDACSAAVLDSRAGRLIAQQSQPMKRGHAEALMPLIGRDSIAINLLVPVSSTAAAQASSAVSMARISMGRRRMEKERMASGE